jgi:hypothetical protein
MARSSGSTRRRALLKVGSADILDDSVRGRDSTPTPCAEPTFATTA